MRKALLVLAILTLPAACRAWHSLDPPFGQAVAQRSLSRIRLTLRDSTRIEMMKPISEADSLVGVDKQSRRITAATDEIVSVEERVTDAMSTAVLLVVIGGTAVWLYHGYCCTGT